MSGHTPGPWKLVDVIGQCTLWAGSRQLLRYTSPDSENLANAKLMASAPDLLEALIEIEAAYSRLSNWEFAGSQNQNPQVSGPIAIKARAAIAKAKGESQ